MLAGLGPRRAEVEAVPHRVDVLHQDVDRGLDLAGRHALGERVQQLAEVGRLVGPGDASGLALEEPLGRADQHRLEHAGRDRHRLVGVTDRLHGAAGGAGAPPGRRVGARHQRRAEPIDSPASRASRRAAASRSGSVVAGSATVRRSSLTRPGHRQRPRRAADDLLDGDAELLEEARRLLAVVVGGGDRGDDEALARAGARDVEEPPLLHQQLARRRPAGRCRPRRSGRPAAASSGAAGRASPPAGRGRRRPAATPGPWTRWAVRRRTAAPRAPRSASVSAGICCCTRVARKARTPTWSRCSSARAATSKSAQTESRSRWARRAAPPPRSTERRSRGRPAGARPERSRAAPRRRRPRPAPRGRRRAAGRARGPGPPRRPRARRGSPGSTTAARTSSREVRGGRSSALLCSFSRARSSRARRRTSPASSAAERAEQQRLGAGRVEVVDVLVLAPRLWSVEVDHRTQPVEQRQHRRVADQRHLVAGHLDRDAGRAERAAQRRDRRTPRTDQHRHVVPGDAVLEVGAAKQVGEVLGLGALGVEGADDDAARRPGRRRRPRVEERLARLERDRAGQRQPVGEALRGDQHPRTEASGGAQRDDVGGRTVGPREVGREVEDAAHLGAAEAVDRLVRVADDGEVAAVAGQRPEQRHLAGVGVLVLVDEDVAQPGAQLVAVGLGLDRGPADQVGVVGRALAVEVGEVLVEEEARRHELRQPLGLAERRAARRRPDPSRARGTARRGPRARSRGCRARGPATRARSPTPGGR